MPTTGVTLAERAAQSTAADLPSLAPNALGAGVVILGGLASVLLRVGAITVDSGWYWLFFVACQSMAAVMLVLALESWQVYGWGIRTRELNYF